MNNAPVIYVPEFIRDADHAFKTLRAELAWIRHDKVPRSEYYSNDTAAPYTYGDPRFARTYMPQPWHPIMREHVNQVNEFLGSNLDVNFLNMYEDGHDQLGYHADDSPEMDNDDYIVSISLGEEREIWARANEREAWRLVDVYVTEHEKGEASPERRKELFLMFRKPQVWLLGHGSIFAMKPGMQLTHDHRIPKSSKHICLPRISETLRHYLPLVA
jgi:alkylated DNA repair dioxygenase AlkB